MALSEKMTVEISGEYPIDKDRYYAELELPTIRTRIEDAKHRARWDKGDAVYKEFEIYNCERFPEIEDLRLDTTTPEEMNYFARRLAELPEEDILKFWGVFNYLCKEKQFADEPVSVKDLINITYGLDGVMIASNVGNDEQLGQFVIENDMNDDIADIPDNALYLLDKAHIGRLQRKNDGGVFEQGSYIVAGGFEMPSVYDGIHIPDDDDSAVFKLKVVSADYDEPEDADAIAEWISLPIPIEEANRFVKELFDAKSIEDCVFFGFESGIPQITDNVFEVMTDFGTLNAIAERYQAMSPAEQIKYKAILEGEKIDNIRDALKITEHLHEYELYQESTDADSFYRDYLRYHMDTGLDSRWLGGTIRTPEAAVLMKRLGAKQTDYGILSARGGSLFGIVPYDEQAEKKELKTQSMTDEKLEVVEVLGQAALFTEGRVTEPLPDGLYKYDLRSGESISFATVEPHVTVDHAGTLIMGERLDFGEKGYIELDEDSSPNFSGDEMSISEFSEEYARVQTDTGQQLGGM